MSTTRPQTLGGSINVADSDDLAALDIDGLPLGSRVANQDVGAEFALTSYSPDDRSITMTAGDEVVASTRIWTFAEGNFFDGNLYANLTIADAENDQNNGVHVIEEVISATEVKTFARSVPLVDEAFDEGVVTAEVQDLMPAPVTDEIVAVNGQSGIRWVKVTPGAVVSLTAGNRISVDATDPAAPVVAVTKSRASAIVSGAATDTLTVSGLSEDTYGPYLIQGKLILANTGADNLTKLECNADTSNHTSVILSIVASGTVGTPSGWGYVRVCNDRNITFNVRGTIGRVGTGLERLIELTVYNDTYFVIVRGRWTNTLNDLTSVRLTTNQAAGFSVGTTLELMPITAGR